MEWQINKGRTWWILWYVDEIKNATRKIGEKITFSNLGFLRQRLNIQNFCDQSCNDLAYW